MDIALTTQALTKKYGETVAVDELDLTVTKGEIFGLVGPDGAGKTTVLRMLSTAILPDGGSAKVAGFDVASEAKEVKLRIGYMPQRFSLYGDLTVSENIDFFADLYQVPEETAAQRKVELLQANNLQDFTHRPAEQLSGGMKKKLALTCTLVHTPEILILDEPTTGVDPLSRREFWKILHSLTPRVTIVISTPYMDEAERCSRIGLMNKGRLALVDRPKEILNKFPNEIIEIKCDCLRASKELLKGFPGVLDINVFGDSLRLYVASAAAVKSALEDFIRQNNFNVFSIAQARPRLEDVFLSLLR
jgi:ABC-2 type transport system ATP-binding protein